MRSRKYLVPVREMGKTLWTSTRPSLLGSSGLSGWTLMSKKRIPLSSCSGGEVAWQRTEGRALWQVGELWVPGIESAESGVSSFRLRIQHWRFAVE